MKEKDWNENNPRSKKLIDNKNENLWIKIVPLKNKGWSKGSESYWRRGESDVGVAIDWRIVLVVTSRLNFVCLWFLCYFQIKNSQKFLDLFWF